MEQVTSFWLRTLWNKILIFIILFFIIKKQSQYKYTLRFLQRNVIHTHTHTQDYNNNNFKSCHQLLYSFISEHNCAYIFLIQFQLFNRDIPEARSRTSLERVESAKGLADSRRECTNKDGRKVIFSFLALPWSFAGPRERPPSTHIPGALNAALFSLPRSYRSVGPAICRRGGPRLFSIRPRPDRRRHRSAPRMCSYSDTWPDYASSSRFDAARGEDPFVWCAQVVIVNMLLRRKLGAQNQYFILFHNNFSTSSLST